jgi:putative membrane protein
MPIAVTRRRPVLWASAVLLAVFTYDAVLRAALVGLVALPLVPGGLKVLTLILTLFSVTHAWYSLGGRATTAFFVLSAAISWGYEQVGVMTGLVFGPYHYTDYLGPKLGDVPLLIPLAWFMMIYPSYVTANLIGTGRADVAGGGAGSDGGGACRLIGLAAISAVVMTAWDLVIDPILSGPSAKAWIWETGGPYFGIPIQNYAGWLLTTFTVYLAYRWLARRWAGAGAGGSAAASLACAGRAAAAGESVAWAMPVAAYGLMLAADLLSGAAPAGLVVIGPIAMGLPLVLAVARSIQPGRRIHHDAATHATPALGENP